MYQLLKPLLFWLPPERAHYLTVSLLHFANAIPPIRHWLSRQFIVRDQRLERQLWGLHFPNPVGLAAGFDKDGKHFRDMAILGFGFLEIGTVTPLPQSGNPKPRLFRLPSDDALINRLGFNNEGVDALVQRLQKKRPPGIVIGGNIGKNKTTPNQEALKDYETCFVKLFPYVDYFVVNVSSPNTPNLRALQEKEPLTRLLQHLQTLNRAEEKPKPILLKIAPDLNEAQLDDILEIVESAGIDGIIATNTTIGRTGLHYTKEKMEKIGPGGLSGQPLRERSTEVIRYLNEHSRGPIVIIGVGGISSAQDAIEKIAAGASLVQIYTGLVYQGPMLVKRINQALIDR